MKTTTHRPPLLAVAALVFALGTGVSAQNDDVGIGKTTTPADPPPTTPDDNQASAAQGVDFTLTGSVAEEAMIGELASIVVSPVAGAVMDVAVIEPEEGTPVVTPVAGVPSMIEIAEDGSTSVQGHGHWVIPEGLDVVMHAAPQAQVRVAVLLAQFPEDGQVPAFTDVLAHGSGISMAFVLGDAPTIDVGKLQKLAQKHHDTMPDLVLTWAFASIGPSGEHHVSGVRASSDGTLLEVITQ